MPSRILQNFAINCLNLFILPALWGREATSEAVATALGVPCNFRHISWKQNSSFRDLLSHFEKLRNWWSPKLLIVVVEGSKTAFHLFLCVRQEWNCRALSKDTSVILSLAFPSWFVSGFSFFLRSVSSLPVPCPRLQPLKQPGCNSRAALVVCLHLTYENY